MICLAIIAALIAAPALAATVEDPDSPRFAEGLRVLGMRDQVEVVRITELAFRHAEIFAQVSRHPTGDPCVGPGDLEPAVRRAPVAGTVAAVRSFLALVHGRSWCRPW